MRSIKEISLSETVLTKLLKYCEKREYVADQDVIYKGHSPHVGFLIIKGIGIAKGSKSVKYLAPGVCVGIRELANGGQLKYNFQIKSGAVTLIVDKSALYEMRESEDPDIQFFVEKAIA
ncbi:MAG: hypothetical protein ACPGJV_15490 [Bacteriovoracaceae bacterium]